MHRGSERRSEEEWGEGRYNSQTYMCDTRSVRSTVRPFIISEHITGDQLSTQSIHIYCSVWQCSANEGQIGRPAVAYVEALDYQRMIIRSL